MQNNLGLFLTKRAFLSPDLDGYVAGDGSFRLTYRSLNESCNCVANAFAAAGTSCHAGATPARRGIFLRRFS